MERINESSRYPEFADTVNSNMGKEQQEQVSNPNFEHISNGKSHADIRNRGGFITDLVLDGEKILYTPENSTLLESKMRASHPMAPAGPSEGIGKQHGPFRWIDYHQLWNDGSTVALQAERPDLGLGSARLYQLDENSITIEHRLLNSTHESEQTSVGEHLYFQLPDKLDRTILDGIRINDKRLSEALSVEEYESILNDGTPVIADAFSEGPVKISLPNHEIELSSELLTGQDDTPTGTPVDLWIWYKSDSASICFEPVAGTHRENDELKNADLVIPAYDLVNLKTRIKVL
jgi:galactose mutarotase-like enzyme